MRCPPALSTIDGVRHAVLVEFPRGERRALVARPRFIDPDMDGQPGIVGHENRRERRAPIDAGEPAGVAMGEDVELAHAWRGFFRQNFAENFEAVTADGFVDRDILVAQLGGAFARRRSRRFSGGKLRDRGLHLVERPVQIDRRGTRLMSVLGAAQIAASPGSSRMARHIP